MNTRHHLLTIPGSTETKALKPLRYFHFAALSLVIAGYVLFGEKNWLHLIMTTWTCISGVFLVYRFNDYTDHTKEFKFDFRTFWDLPFNRFMVLQFVLLNIPLAAWTMTPFIFKLLIGMSAVGIGYSLTAKLGDYILRLKNVLLLKNLMIGLIWGALILIGAGSATDPLVNILFIFASVQVVIGSMIRDLPDVGQDIEMGVKSMPVIFGSHATMVFMHLMNALSFIVPVLLLDNTPMLLAFAGVAIWRTVVLVHVDRNPDERKWSDNRNLLTCFLLGALIIAAKIYMDVV